MFMIQLERSGEEEEKRPLISRSNYPEKVSHGIMMRCVTPAGREGSQLLERDSGTVLHKDLAFPEEAILREETPLNVSCGNGVNWS